jgi:hypothetical protein
MAAVQENLTALNFAYVGVKQKHICGLDERLLASQEALTTYY